MKQYCYIVKFATGQQEQVFASGKNEAIILAQAEQIRKGYQYQCVIDVYTIE